MNNPTPDEIKEARQAMALTQNQAAQLVHRDISAWQRWEQGARKMPLGTWELFLLKTQKPQQPQ